MTSPAQTTKKNRKIIRFPAVNGKTSLSKSSIRRGMLNGTFPQSVVLGLGSVGWYEDEIDEWIANRSRGVAEKSPGHDARRGRPRKHPPKLSEVPPPI